MGDDGLTPPPTGFLDRPVVEVAPALLGAVLRRRTPDGEVAVRLTEVEAYAGPDDPGSHARRGPTPRTQVMFGPSGHLYVYFSYGMHWCVNVVCGPVGHASAVLLRAGEVVEGAPLARSRRPGASDRDLARGPARLARACALAGTDDSAALGTGEHRLLLGPPPAPARIRSGPRVGVAGEGAQRPWRFWLDGEPTVSPYRAARPREPRRPRVEGSPA